MMSVNPVIGISGKMLSGKDTVTHILMEKLKKAGFMPYKTSFAGALKEEVQEIFDLVEPSDNLLSLVHKMENYHQVGSEDLVKMAQMIIREENFMQLDVNERTPAIRKMVQFWGGVKKKQNPNYWVERVEFFAEGKHIPIISDCRFIKEAEWIKRHGYLFRLEVSPNEQKRRMLERDGFFDEKNLNHVSETDLDNFPFGYRFNTDEMSAEEISDKILEMIM